MVVAVLVLFQFHAHFSTEELTKDALPKLKAAGVTEIAIYEPGHWELVCEELCGANHFTMRGQVVVLDSEEYRARFQGGTKSTPPPATKPSNVAAVN